MKKYLLLACCLLAISCTKVFHLSEVQLASYSVNEEAAISPDAEIEALIQPYKNQLDEAINEIIGTSAITMTKDKPQSTLGNWMADLIHQQSEKYYNQSIDFGIVNYGGIRISELRKGPVSLGKMYELMPFENMLVVVKVKGDVVQQLFDKMAAAGGWPISKQVRYEIKNDLPQNIIINQKEIDPNKTYKIAMVDFLANGGNNCFFFKDQPRDVLNHLFRSAIIEFVKEETAQGKLLDAEIDHRVRLID